MVETSAEPRTRLHIISHLTWEREGHQTFDSQRALLLNILSQLLEHMQKSGETRLENFLLGGQTIILDDVAQVRPELLTSLVIYNAGGRLGIGPWYVQMDSLLADGEALVRNLLIGRADTRRYGLKLMNIAYMPDTCQHTAQMPQILRGFGIESAFLCSGNPIMPLPFNWESPDGCGVLVINYKQHDDPATSVEAQREGQPDGPFLWMHQVASPEMLAAEFMKTKVDVPVQQSNLADYAASLREMLPDELRPILKGEVHLQYHDAISGRLSARITHKQAAGQMQAELIHVTEPLLALAQAHGHVRYPLNQAALLDHSWRLLLQNLARYPIAGAVTDEVAAEMTIRTRRIADNSKQVIEAALDALPGTPSQFKRLAKPAPTTETYITVWNTHGHPVQQVVELALQLPQGYHPAVLIGSAGEERAFSWNPETATLGFRADAPSVGYVVYTLQLSNDETAAYNQPRSTIGESIGSASGESLGISNGQLDWTLPNIQISNFVSYHDGGDAGDVWHYVEPEPDVVVQASIVDVVQVESTPTYERLTFRNRMRVAPGLTDGKSRGRGLKVLDLMTTATYYSDLPGIHFRTVISNTADDHRLRVHIRTGLNTETIYADAAFGMVKRPALADQAVGTQPLHNIAALHDKERGLAIFTRGLHEFEPIHEDNQVTIAFTLLRAVGRLDLGEGTHASGTQMPGDFVSEFMIVPLGTEHHHASLMQMAQDYRAPLHAYQYDEKPAQLQQCYLELDHDRAVITSIKPAHSGNSMIVRILNPSKDAIRTTLTAHGALRHAFSLNMAEETLGEFTIENGKFELTLKPYQILTLRLDY